MSIIIDVVGNKKNVYLDRKIIGRVKKSCCGVDFFITSKPNAIFSILSVGIKSIKLPFLIEQILSLDIPDKPFHFNFNMKTASSKKNMKEYQDRLNAIK